MWRQALNFSVPDGPRVSWEELAGSVLGRVGAVAVVAGLVARHEAGDGIWVLNPVHHPAESRPGMAPPTTKGRAGGRPPAFDPTAYQDRNTPSRSPGIDARHDPPVRKGVKMPSYPVVAAPASAVMVSPQEPINVCSDVPISERPLSSIR
jgi:hypothetical protein